jgi:hypothetical protein
MTHYRVLVIGPHDDVGRQLAPFDENLQVAPYFDPISESSLSGMRTEYGISANAGLDAYCAVMRDWTGEDAVIVDGVLGTLSTYNPLSKWDYWTPLELPAIDGSSRPNLTKGEVDLARIRSELPGAAPSVAGRKPAVLPTYAVLAEGVWREPGRVGWFGSSDATDTSRAEFDDWYARLWDALPDETPLTLVDCHI